MRFEKKLVKMIKGGLILALLVPLVFANFLAFPVITAKAFFFQTIVEVLAVFYAALAVVSPRYRPRLSLLGAAVATFFVVLIVTGLTGLNPYHSFFGTFERMWGVFFWLHVLTFFIMSAAVFTADKDWQFLFKFSVFVSVIVSVLALYQRSVGLPPVSTIGNTAFLASYLMLNVFLALWLFLRSGNIIPRLIYGAAFLVTLAGFLIANSRGAFLGLVAGFGFLFLGVIAASKRFRLPALAAAVVLVLILSVLYVNRDRPWISQNLYFGHLMQISLNESTAQTRLLAWQAAWQTFKERPFFGVGQENFNLVFNKYFQPRFYEVSPTDIWFDRAHNQPLDFLANAGIFGFLSYLAIFAAAFYALYKRKDLVLAAGLSAYFVQNLFMFDNQSSILGFFLLLAYLSAVPGPAADNTAAGRQPGRKMPATGVLAAVGMAFLSGILIYKFNVRPALAANQLIRAQVLIDEAKGNENDEAVISAFRQGIAYGTFGTGEIRKFYAKFYIDRVLQGKAFDQRLLKDNLSPAIAEIENNVRENPLDVYPLMQLADLQVIDMAFLGDMKKADAEATSKKMIALNPGRIEGYALLVQIQYTAGEYPQALDILTKAVKMAPGYADPHYRLSLVYEALNRHDESEAELDLAYRFGYNVTNVLDFMKLANFYIKKGDYGAAVAVTEKAVLAQPQNFKLWAMLAAGYAQIGEYQKARDAGGVVLKIAPPEFQDQARQFLQSIERK